MYKLYPYQINVVSKITSDLTNTGNSLVVMPTGSGKSYIIAEIAKWLQKPILILQPSIEILRQNREKLSMVVGKDDIGVFSASAGEKTIKTYTLATIGSVYRKPEHFKHFGLVLIDECHLVNHKKLSTMYMFFLKQIGQPKCIGLTATPYRLESWGERLQNGYILSHTVTKMINRCWNPFWSRILVAISTGDLIDAGYLCKPTYIEREIIKRQMLKPNVSHTDYDLTFFEKVTQDKQSEIVRVIEWAKEDNKHVLVFCSSVAQAEALKQQIEGSEVIFAKTNKKERIRVIDEFKQGKIKVVLNVECLTTGFDFPSLDCIVVLRPTQSIRLHVQMLGRGVRVTPDKKTCNIIDMVGNVKKLGKIETIRVERLNTGWDIVSEVGNFHNKELHSYLVQTST